MLKTAAIPGWGRLARYLLFGQQMTTAQPVTEEVDVMVVGAGPVGLFAALCANDLGLSVALLDHVWRGYGRGHATLLHSRALGLLERHGLRALIHPESARVDRLELHVDQALVRTIDLPEPALAVSQLTLEKVLLAALRERGVEVRAPQEARTFVQGKDAVNVHVMRRELVTLGSPAHYSEWEPVDFSKISARFVIGADGYESRTREALGIEAIEVGALQSFAMFEVPNREPASSTARLGLDGGLGDVRYPLPGQRTRFGFQLSEGLDLPPDAARLRSLLSSRCPEVRLDDTGELDVQWASVMHFERRLSRRFGRGRIWLAGDAAHVTSPLGNQSMNVGLFEAYDLTRRIADCLRSGESPSALERYGSEREREWHKLLGVNVSFELLPGAPSWLSAHARRLVPALPASGPELSEILRELGLRLD
jgi:2-polyprenyl-6-methoxyphenol hydroxylase-like FAD-dependent oxidoreductase